MGDIFKTDRWSARAIRTIRGNTRAGKAVERADEGELTRRLARRASKRPAELCSAWTGKSARPHTV